MRALARGASVLAAGALATLGLPAPGTAQIAASERATVSQTVDGTVIEVEYSRPRARGRSPLFGGVVDWGRTWTAGANDATTLSVSEDVTIEGRPLPAGTWSVWLEVERGDRWELVLDPRAERWHTQAPEPSDGQVRVPVPVHRIQDGPDALTWSFPDYGPTGATLQMAWGDHRVPIRIVVEPSMSPTVEAAEVEPYLGSYTLEWEPIPGFAPEGTPPAPFEVRFDAGTSTLRAVTRFPGDEWPDPTVLVLYPRAEGIFEPASTMDGEIMGLLQVHLEFLFGGDGVVTGFEIRSAPDDGLLARGTAGR